MALQTLNIGASPNDKTGDPLRTAANKLNQMLAELYASQTVTLNVKTTFGAVGNGSTDDREALQDAADAAAAAGGGLVFFPTGVYIVSTLVYWPSNTVIMGTGRGAVVVRRQNNSVSDSTPSNTGAIFATGSADGTPYTVSARGSRVAFVDLTVDGNYANQATVTSNGPHADGIRAEYTDEIVLHRVRLMQCINSGLYLYGCRRSAIHASTADDNGHLSGAGSRNGFHITGPQDDSTGQGAQDEHLLIGNQAVNNIDEGFAHGRVGLVVYSGNVAKDNGDMGIEVDTSTATSDTTDVPSGIIVVGNHVKGNTNHGVAVGAPNVQRALIANNVIEEHGKSGITIGLSSGTLAAITGNIVNTYGDSTNHGITVGGGIDDIIVADNLVTDGQSTAAGIAVLGSSYQRNVLIRGNRIRGAGGPGLSTFGAITGIIGHNFVSGTDIGIQINSGSSGDTLDLVLAHNETINNATYGIRVRTNGTSNITRCKLVGNVSLDNRGTKIQDYGLVLAESGGGTITGLVLDHNHFDDNQIGIISGLTNAMVASIEFPQKLRTITFSASITPDAFVGEYIEIGALTAGLTINAPINPIRGLWLRFRILQDGTGGRSVTWNSVFKHAWSDTGNSANTQSTIHFRFDGTNWIQQGAQSPYV